MVKPAEADAEKVRILARADAERTKVQAEAAASHNRVALDRMLIDQLPQIVREAAGGLANANINVLNGADGLGQLAASLVGQGLTIFESIKSNLTNGGDWDDEDEAAVADSTRETGRRRMNVARYSHDRRGQDLGRPDR